MIRQAVMKRRSAAGEVGAAAEVSERDLREVEDKRVSFRSR